MQFGAQHLMSTFWVEFLHWCGAGGDLPISKQVDKFKTLIYMGDFLDLDYWQRRNFVTGDNTEKPRGHDGSKNKSTTQTQIGKCWKE